MCGSFEGGSHALGLHGWQLYLDDEGEGLGGLGHEPWSDRLDETVHDLLAAGLAEIDGELVAVDLGDAAIAKFLVKNAHAHGEAGAFRRARRHQGALDGQRLARAWAGAGAVASAIGSGA